MRVYLGSYPFPIPFIVVVGAWYIIFVRAPPFIFVDIISTTDRPTGTSGERRVGGEIYCAMDASVIEAPGSPMTGALHKLTSLSPRREIYILHLTDSMVRSRKRGPCLKFASMYQKF